MRTPLAPINVKGFEVLHKRDHRDPNLLLTSQVSLHSSRSSLPQFRRSRVIPTPTSMTRFLVFLFGLCSYLAGLAGLTYFILFLGRWEFMPVSIDSRPPISTSSAILVNLGLVLLFGLQHSIMARPGFKKAWTKLVPKAAERSCYVLFSGLIMFAYCYYWQNIEGQLWNLQGTAVGYVLFAGYLIGWLITVSSSFVINHFELFGLQQIYFNLKGQPAPTLKFTERFYYKVVRHPIQLGVLIGVWSTPVMSYSQLMLAISFTIYIFIGLYYEERDLVASLGEDYEDYKKRVPKVIPFTKFPK